MNLLLCRRSTCLLAFQLETIREIRTSGGQAPVSIVFRNETVLETDGVDEVVDFTGSLLPVPEFLHPGTEGSVQALLLVADKIYALLDEEKYLVRTRLK